MAGRPRTRWTGLGGATGHDLSLAKSFAITERYRLQFRAEAFNATNTANFGFPAANINAANVGAITSADEPRRVQFALKLIF